MACNIGLGRSHVPELKNRNIYNNNAGAAANHAVTNKNTKYSQLSNTHVFVPVAIETGCTWHHQVVELVQELGRRTADSTGDARESQLPFPAAVRGTTEGECGLISKHVHHQLAHCNPLFHMFNVLVPTGFVLVGQKIIIIITSISNAP